MLTQPTSFHPLIKCFLSFSLSLLAGVHIGEVCNYYTYVDKAISVIQVSFPMILYSYFRITDDSNYFRITDSSK